MCGQSPNQEQEPKDTDLDNVDMDWFQVKHMIIYRGNGSYIYIYIENHFNVFCILILSQIRFLWLHQIMWPPWFEF